MRRVTIDAPNVIAPVFASAEVVVLLLTSMASQTSLGCLFGGLVLEVNDLAGISLINVLLAWSMARFAPSDLVFPISDICEF